MTEAERDALFRRYLSTRQLGGTAQECRFAFDQWWKHERAAAFASVKADKKALKRRQARSAHA